MTGILSAVFSIMLAASATIDEADCNSLLAQQAMSMHRGYVSLGGMSWWNAHSSFACEDNGGVGSSAEDELLSLARSHESAANDLDVRLGGRVTRFCRLFADKDITFDPRKHMREAGMNRLPNEIVYVAEIYGGALFSLECLASGQFGPMPAEPGDL